MTKQLTLEEMIWCARATSDPQMVQEALFFTSQIETLSGAFGQKLARHLGVKSGFTSIDIGGILTPFYATDPTQDCPAPLHQYDEDEWTTEDGVAAGTHKGKRSLQ
jgi:hypothetical protein